MALAEDLKRGQTKERVLSDGSQVGLCWSQSLQAYIVWVDYRSGGSDESLFTSAARAARRYRLLGREILEEG